MFKVVSFLHSNGCYRFYIIIFFFLQERTLTLDQPVKIGRSVARARPAPNNAIFDCKVLSRNHALLWYENGKVIVLMDLCSCCVSQMFPYSSICKTPKVATVHLLTINALVKAQRNLHLVKYAPEILFNLEWMSWRILGKVDTNTFW
jgi:hypothetical protein